MNVLHLTLKKKWFDMIASGEKKEEYRQIKAYWKTRLENKEFDVVSFRNGYSKNAPTMVVDYLGFDRGIGKEKWGATGVEVFVLKLGDVLTLTPGVQQ